MSEQIPSARLFYDSSDLNANNFSVDEELFKREVKTEPDDEPHEDERTTESQPPIKQERFYEELNYAGRRPVGLGRLTGERTPFTCDPCGLRFKRKDRLLRHLMTHGLVDPHVCPVCRRAFNRSDALAKHVAAVHRGPEAEGARFSCDLCGKTFKRPDSVRRHERAHAGRREFYCHLCGRWFAQHSVLQRHVRSHTKEAPFGCGACDKRYTRRYILARHVAAKHAAFTPLT